MKISEAIEILERHNQWRRGAKIPMEHPKSLGVAIETILSELRYASQEREGIEQLIENCKLILENTKEVTPLDDIDYHELIIVKNLYRRFISELEKILK